jgi:indolepyruvate ferredoxin oxidoreductase beta subunit
VSTMKTVNVLIVGVGGQGVILASDILAKVGMEYGFDVKKSDSLGMAQRGGSVVSHVRWGTRVFSPLVAKGEVDFLLGLEQLETARWAPYLKEGGVAVVSDVVMMPVSAINSAVPYPDWLKVKAILEQYTDQVHLLPTTVLGHELGNPRAINMLMLGFLSFFLEVPESAWREHISHKLNSRFVEPGLQAFNRGRQEATAMKSAKEARQ